MSRIVSGFVLATSVIDRRFLPLRELVVKDSILFSSGLSHSCEINILDTSSSAFSVEEDEKV